MTTASEVSPVRANEFIEQELNARLSKIENAFSADALGLCGPLLDGVDDILRTVVERRCTANPHCTKLVVMLTTEGGYLEPVQRMVAVLRQHYQIVDFVIPNHAYSAGTVFALSGDAIYMDYYSRLGPIDPQIKSSQGRTVSALGYIEKYNDLIERATNGDITPAEIQLLIMGFDQAELYSYEQARDSSVAALEEWLVKYKFKNWDQTETRGLQVTDEMKKERAKKIGYDLNDTERWHSHGYGLSMDVLKSDLDVFIDDFGKDQKKSSAIKAYHELLSDYMEKRRAGGVIHVVGDYRSYV